MESDFAVTVTTIYALSMSKKVFVQLVGKEHNIVVDGDGIDETPNEVIVKKGANIVAKFYKTNVQGWWIEDR